MPKITYSNDDEESGHAEVSRNVYSNNEHKRRNHNHKHGEHRSHSVPPTVDGRSKLAASFPPRQPSHHHQEERDPSPPQSPSFHQEDTPRSTSKLHHNNHHQQHHRHHHKNYHHHRHQDEEDEDHHPQFKSSHRHRSQTRVENNEYEEAEDLPVPHSPSKGNPHPLESRRSGSSNSLKSNQIDHKQQRNFSRNEYEPPSPNLHVDSCPSDTNNDAAGNAKALKKVSYAPESKPHVNLTGGYVNMAPIPCRLRADVVEPDESDINCSIETCPKVRHPSIVPPPSRAPYGDPLHPESLLVSSVDSERSFLGLGGLSQQHQSQHYQQHNMHEKEDNYYLKKSPNNNLINEGGSSSCLNRFSQESMLSVSGASGSGRGPPSSYSKDVLPLPIEIPENVANIEAFRHYLSNHSSPSYESLGGRRPGRASVGLTLTPSRAQLGHEASKRTATLSHAIMTLALLSASICQLRFLVTYSHAHSYPVLNYFLIFTSIILEIAAGIGYVMISRCNYDDDRTEAIHNYLIFALFIVTVANVILAAFAFDGHICDDFTKKTGTPGPDSRSSYATHGHYGQQHQKQSHQISQGLSLSRTGVGDDDTAADSGENRETNLKYNAIE